MTDDASQPVEKFFESQRLRLAYWDWGNEDAPPLVLVHGGRDHSRQWDNVARVLRDRFHVVALDLRGHGDSEWAVGSQYGLPDIALDIVRMIEVVGAPATVICHSYGAQASTVAAAAYPEHFARLVAVEGVASGVIRDRDMAPDWIREWGDRARESETPRMRVYRTIEEAAGRLLEQNDGLPRDLLHTIASYATKPVAGGYVWKFDGWVLNRTSMEIRRDEMQRFWAKITCPTLLVAGSASHLPINPDIPVLEIFPNARLALIEGARHWVHHDRFEEFMAQVTAFFQEVPLEQ